MKTAFVNAQPLFELSFDADQLMTKEFRAYNKLMPLSNSSTSKTGKYFEWVKTFTTNFL